jgi:hypothetical protein
MYKNISLDNIRKKKNKEKKKNLKKKKKKKKKEKKYFFFIMYQYDLLSIRRVWRYQRVIKIRKY